MKTFNDLVFDKHESAISAEKTIKLYPSLMESNKRFLGAKHAVMTFDNGRVISVIFGKLFYSDGVSTYEAWELDGDDDEPRGYLTKDEVTSYMIEIQKKDKK